MLHSNMNCIFKNLGQVCKLVTLAIKVKVKLIFELLKFVISCGCDNFELF